MIYWKLLLLFGTILIFLNKKNNVRNIKLIEKKKKNLYDNHIYEIACVKTRKRKFPSLYLFKNINRYNKIIKKNKKENKIFFDRNGINVPEDVAMFGKTNVYYVRENIYDKNKNNLIPNEVESEYIEELNGHNGNNSVNNMDRVNNISSDDNINSVNNLLGQAESQQFNTNKSSPAMSSYNNTTPKEGTEEDSIFTYINKDRDYVTQVGNSPNINIYERTYQADSKYLYKQFENVNEVNLQLLKNIKNVDDKEKLINKKVVEKVKEDIKRFQETDEIMDIKGRIVKTNNDLKHKVKDDQGKKNTNTQDDMDEEEKNEVIKKLYMIEKKTDKYLEENIYFVIQSWLPDIRIDDTLILIDNIEKSYNEFDMSKYYDQFNEAKKKDFYYDLPHYEIENIPQNINDDTEIECEHINSYNNTYNKLNNYNLKKYSYTYTTNENADTKFNKNEPMPPIVLINTKKNLMVQQWESKHFKNRHKRNKSHEFTRIQRAFRPFSYVDLSDITCIYKNNFLQLKMKLSHRKYKNDIYPFFIPINNAKEELIDFNGYKRSGDYSWSFFWHNFNYDKDTDYNFLNRNIKLNITETKFEDVHKKKAKKIMKKILLETKGKKR
ncbi:conserved Plasmodium protein, unknown function [Plasmodium sp. gorilla clade G2]|uniref:conserved Plasmodium protein, unknown function n=1 Tax=Plasmodium sp. gorilla clade G2 TaxID=880535 RepID=UPI000D1FED43|nr:conserved Plasmodium protein, unknown function [Plasmodium sp. gorilla clade G2]SOV14158.1 conserved Plasmodium protein, unknown function [Plasmodium sp. gorilla clade G2]